MESAEASKVTEFRTRWQGGDGGDPAFDSAGASKRRPGQSLVHNVDATTKAKWLYQSCMNHGQYLAVANKAVPLLPALPLA